MRAVQATLLVLAIVEITLVVLAAVVLAAKTAHVAWPRTRIASLCLLVISITWVVVARMHPIYVASPFLLIGLSLAHMQWWPMLLSLVVIPIHIVRGRREAAVLREAFVEESIAFALGLGSSCFRFVNQVAGLSPVLGLSALTALLGSYAPFGERSRTRSAQQYPLRPSTRRAGQRGGAAHGAISGPPRKSQGLISRLSGA